MGDIGNARPIVESKANCLTYMVKGNTDYDFELKDSVSIDFYGKRIVATHGHRYTEYGVSDNLVYFGRENNADVLLFGHIHRPVLCEAGGLIICNPGSISRPRQGRECTFAILELDDETHDNRDISIVHYSADIDIHNKLVIKRFEL